MGTRNRQSVRARGPDPRVSALAWTDVGEPSESARHEGGFFEVEMAKTADIFPFSSTAISCFSIKMTKKRFVGVIDKSAQLCFTRALSFIKSYGI